MSTKKLTVLLAISILISIAIISGITYAYLSVNAKQTTSNVIETTCFSTNFTESNKLNVTSYPMSNAKGLATTPYSFTVTNNCSNNTNYYVYLNILNNSSTNLLNYINYSIDGKTVKKLANLNSTSLPSGVNIGNDILKSYVINTGTISTSKTFTLYMWIDESAGNDIMGNTFSAKIAVYNALG